jgi:hypothetical protein
LAFFGSAYVEIFLAVFNYYAGVVFCNSAFAMLARALLKQYEIGFISELLFYALADISKGYIESNG